MRSVAVKYPSGKIGDVTPPTVNLNGSSPDSLRDAYDDAIAHVSSALDALYQGAPNGRDYQTAGEHAYRAARQEHDRRITALRDVVAELVALRDDIQDQIDARAVRK